MDISAEEVLKLAHLARLELTPEEVERMRRDLGAILGYVGKLSELDTSQIAPTAHVLDIETPVRDDAVTAKLQVQEAVRNSPQHDASSMIVPKVIE
jgi:aspartyl-tRNA(Asn)/glutamyl-tRNA(Gln) amidotransferase subunit C